MTDPIQPDPAKIDPARLYAQAISAYQQGDWRQARELSMQLLPQSPRHAGVHYLAGVSALALLQMPHALTYLQRACMLDPGRADYSTQFAKALSMVNLSAQSIAVAEHALSLSPLDAQALDTLGVVFTRANAHGKATELYGRAVALAPSYADYHLNFAKSLVFTGDMDTAERELEACIGLAPLHSGAHLALSQLRRRTRDNHHLDRLHALLPQTRENKVAQANLHMALAKEYEDLTDYSRAFEHLAASNAACASQLGYSTRHDEALFETLMRASPAPQPAAAGFPTDEPIFVVGMPRSGTTLVDRILSSHPDVHSAGELQQFALAFKRASGSRTPQMIDVDTVTCAQNLDWRKLGENYLASTRPDTGHTPRFVDKQPHNFLHVGAIANALPNARIICLRRDPMDTCLSNFRQLFTLASPYHGYAYDLLDIGRYYILFDRLMTHWKHAFPGRILEIDYEDLVAAQEAGTRQLLAFCGLSWHDACLHFEDNQAPATTASAVQVREPIHRRAVQRWKQYETQLAGLRELLESAGIALKP
ncbi:MAG: sulfotransferase [Rhodanobacter sp.]